MPVMAIQWDVETITDANVQIDHAQAVAEITTEKRHRGEMFRAALYTYRVCYVTRAVGQGAGRMPFQDYASQLGYAKSYITLLRRLGRALVVHGVTADSELFSILTRAATKREVAALLDREDAVPHSDIRRVVAQFAAHLEHRSRDDGGACRRAEEDLRVAVESVRSSIPIADTALLERLETTVGDLFFDLRQARMIGRN